MHLPRQPLPNAFIKEHCLTAKKKKNVGKIASPDTNEDVLAPLYMLPPPPYVHVWACEGLMHVQVNPIAEEKARFKNFKARCFELVD
jgi:hypothetical protein